MELDFNTASSAQLKAFKKSLTLDEATTEQLLQVEQLDELIIERMVDERMAGVEQKHLFREKAGKLDKKAHKDWPELADTKSDFAKKVNAFLEEAGGGESDPAALLNAANSVGLDMGMVPSARRDGAGTTDPTRS